MRQLFNDFAYLGADSFAYHIRRFLYDDDLLLLMPCRDAICDAAFSAIYAF